MKVKRIYEVRVLIIACIYLMVMCGTVFARPPKVITAMPDNGEVNVDPQLQQIRIVFDQDMNQGGYSVCGGGPKFPNIIGQPGWLNSKTFVMRVRLEPNHEYEFGINSPSARNFMNDQGESAEIYVIRFKTGSGKEAIQGKVNDKTKAVSDMNRKVALLNVGKSTIRDVIRVFGEPMRYLWGDKTFKKENLPGRYVAMYPKAFEVLMSDGHVTELRYEEPSSYSFLGKIQIGASPQEAVRVVGRPKKIVKGKPNEFADGVFYRDIDGQKGRCYYGRKDKGVRFFFMDNKITHIYVTRDDRSGLPEAFTVAFKAAGPSGPKTARELLGAFNENHPSGVRTHRFITKLKDGILIGYIQVDGQKGKEAIEKMISQNPKLALVIEEPAADDETKEEAAVDSARAWLKIVDMGDYAGSWEQTAGLFKAMVSKEQLAQSLGMVRKPLGKMISREVVSQKHTKTLPGLPPGQYVIIQFNTTFENKADAIETVTPMLDKDGLWRVSGYYIR